MPLKTILFVLLFAVCTLGAPAMPLLGITGYVLHYNIGPERQWWEAPISQFNLRYSFTLAAVTAAGIALNYRKLRFGKRLLNRQESLILLFVGAVWLATLITPQSVGRYTTVDHVSVKMTKVAIFILMLTHVVTTKKKLDWLLWVLVIGGLILGMQAYGTPQRAFNSGRIESIGGADFSDANRVGGYLGALLFIIGAMFLRSGWKGRIVCFLAGGFVANGLVLTRSRGAFLGVAFGALAALFLSPREHRGKIAFGLVLAFVGGLYLSDPRFIERMSTITSEQQQMDSSASSRIEIWRGGMRMLMDNPLGVGGGNFYQSIGKYAPAHEGRDAHNTIVRCAGELGFPGLIVFLLLLGITFHSMWRLIKQARALPEEYQRSMSLATFGIATSFVAMLAYGMTGTLIYTEYLWWMFGLSICLSRTMENLQEDLGTESLDREEELESSRHLPAA